MMPVTVVGVALRHGVDDELALLAGAVMPFYRLVLDLVAGHDALAQRGRLRHVLRRQIGRIVAFHLVAPPAEDAFGAAAPQSNLAVGRQGDDRRRHRIHHRAQRLQRCLSGGVGGALLLGEQAGEQGGQDDGEQIGLLFLHQRRVVAHHVAIEDRPPAQR